MNIKTVTGGMLSTNCYLMQKEAGAPAIIIDPGVPAEMVEHALLTLSARPEAILLTHGHFDHISAVRELREKYRIPVYAGREEEALLADPVQNLSGAFSHGMGIKADVLLEDGQELLLAGLPIQVLATPGHTPGGLCFYLPGEEALFSGDTLFHESFGRTDFPGGSMGKLKASVRRLFALPPGTAVYPGHEEATDIGWERMHNPLSDW